MKLATRIILLIALITLLMGLLTIIFSAPVIKQGFRTMDYEWTKSLTGSLSEGIANDTINGNATRVRQIIEAVVLKNKELEYAYVVDFEQHLFAHTFKEGFPKKLFDIVANSDDPNHSHRGKMKRKNNSNNDDEHLRTLQLDGKKIEDISYPIIEGMSARVHLGLSEESDVALLKEINQKLFMIIFILGLAGIVIAFPLSRQLTKPLDQFGKLMQDYGSNKIKGKLDLPTGSSEVNALGSAFKKMVIELEENQNLFFTMFESLSDAVIVANMERCITIVNTSAKKLFGYDEQDLLGNTTSMLYAHPEDFKQIGKQRYNSDAQGDPLHYEVVYQRKNGSVFIGETLGTKITSRDGTTFGFVGIIRDITERKKSEKEIKELNISLEERVKERTKKLESTLFLLTDENEQRKKAENQYREAKEQAEKASAAKSDFLSRMSHELRTPMNAILGFGQLLELDSKKFNESQKANIQEILEAGNHLLELINDVLDLTEIEAGKLEISMEKVELNDVVTQCISLMEPIAKIRQIKQIDNISEKGYIVHADFTRLKQVLLNLLSNAVKYNREKGSITLDGDIIDKQYLRINITDTGEGVKEEDLSKLFASFERLNPKINVEGSGIGLNITKRIVELMGGKVGVMSTLGQGSTFWFELKLAKTV